MLKKSVRTLIALSLATMYLTACDIHTPWGVLRILVDESGVTIRLIRYVRSHDHLITAVDTDDDGAIDHLIDEDNFFAPLFDPGQLRLLADVGPGQLDPADDTNTARALVIPDDPFATPEWNGPLMPEPMFDPPEPFDFEGLGASAWLALTGLANAEPGTTISADALRFDGLDSKTGQTDLWLMWSSELGLPDWTGYDLVHDTYALLGTDADAPAFLAIHIAGHVEQVLALSASLGILEGSIQNDGSAWTVSIDGDSHSAMLLENGTPLLTIDLD